MATFWWERDSGEAACDGVTVELREWPALAGFPPHIVRLSFAQGRGDFRISGGERFEMTREQCEAVDTMVRGIAEGARARIPHV